LLARAALTLGSELRPGTVDRELLAALERARAELAEAGEPGGTLALLGCRVLARLAAVLQPANDPQVPVALALQAIEQARAAGDEGTLVEVLHVAGSALVDYAPIEQRRQHNEELLARAAARSDLPRQLAALGRLAMDQAEYGEFAAWERSVDRLLDLARTVGTPRLRWQALLFGSMRALAKGDLLESERLVTEVRELDELSDDPALALSLGAHVALRAGLLHLDEQLEQLALLRGLEDVPHAQVVHQVLKARAYARLEDEPNARRALEQLPPYDPRLPPEWLGWLVEPCVLTGDLPRCRRLRAELERRAAPQLVGGHVPITYEGPLERLLGLLAAALGEPAVAEQKLRAALAQMEQHGLEAWVAQLRYDLGTVLGRVGRHADARALFAQAAQHAERLGMRALHARAHRRSLDGPAVAAAASLSAQTPGAPAPLSLRREGDVWLVQHGARSARVKHSRGIALLSRLVERPGEDIHVLALSSDDAGASLQDTRVARLDAPDPRALRDYKQRLSDLGEELADAEHRGDLGRAERLERERELLRTELSRALGLVGGTRSTGPAERARVNVQRRLKDAIARISECDAELGRYLEKAVVTGTYCRFLA
jgi:tetratricopeptide (TPR) repeat protein